MLLQTNYSRNGRPPVSSREVQQNNANTTVQPSETASPQLQNNSTSSPGEILDNQSKPSVISSSELSAKSVVCNGVTMKDTSLNEKESYPVEVIHAKFFVKQISSTTFVSSFMKQIVDGKI